MTPSWRQRIHHGERGQFEAQISVGEPAEQAEVSNDGTKPPHCASRQVGNFGLVLRTSNMRPLIWISIAFTRSRWPA